MTPTLPWTGERFVPQLEGNIAFEHLHRYALAADLAAGKAVLDIASGEGYGSNLLSRVAKVVVGVDMDAEAVAHARRAYPADNLTFLVGTCWDIPIPARSVDLVVSYETLEHHDRHLEMMAEVRRVLRPGGILLISSPDKRVYSDGTGYANPYHVRELYLSEFEQLLRSFFGHVVILGQRMCCGSVIAPLDDRFATFVSYGGRPERSHRHPGLRDSRYLIGLASDDPAPPLPASAFEGDGIGTDFHLREGALTQDVQRLSTELAARQEEITLLQRALAERPSLPSGHGGHAGNGTESASRRVVELESTVLEQADVIARVTARLEAATCGDPAATLAAVRDDMWYWRERGRIRAAAVAAIPVGATVAVVSRGDDRLLELGDRRGVHFPQSDDGRHTDRHPDDDAHAVDQLEAVRERGAEYLLIPGYDRWLLDDYPGFGRHLREYYRSVELAADSCLVFALR